VVMTVPVDSFEEQHDHGHAHPHPHKP
jgi:hypothetical protein